MSGSPASTATLPGRLRRNSLANVLGRTFSALAWVSMTPWVLRVMGAERFGVWSLFFALSGSVVAMDLGVMPAVTRFVALAASRQDAGEMHLVLRRARLATLVIGGSWFLLAWGMRGLFCDVFNVPSALRPETMSAFVWFGLSLAVLTAGQLWQGVLNGLQRLDLGNLAWIAGLVVHMLVLGIGLSRGFGLHAAAWGALSGHLVMAMGSWWACRRLLPSGSAGHARGSGWKFGRYGGQVQLTNLLLLAQMQGGRAILGAVRGLAAVTAFELAFRVANTLWSPAVLLQGALVPAAASASARGDLEPLVALLRWGLRWMSALAALAMGGVWVAGLPFLRLWLGPDAGYDGTTIHLLATAFLVATPALSAAAIARGAGRPALEGQFFALAAAVQVLVALIYAPGQGAAGSAWALVVSFAIASVMLLMRVTHWLRLPLLTTLFRDVLPHVLPGIFAALVAIALGRWFIPIAPAHTMSAFSIPVTIYLLLWLLMGLVPGNTQALWNRLRMGRATA